MKIIVLAVASTCLALAGPVDEMRAGTHKKEGKSLPYRWIKIGKAERPALILFLHGAGERGDCNKVQLKHGIPDLLKWLKADGQSAVVIAPQCNQGVWWADLRGDFRSPKGGDLANKPSAMMTMVFEVVDKMAKAHKIDSKRIYVTGLSMGGFGSFAAVARRPDFFAAAMPICGGGDPLTAKVMKDVPFWVFHGTADRAVPLKASSIMVDALKNAGAEVKFKKYSNVGHDSWTATYRNPKVWEWLFSKTKP
ncbi:MAG: prolyl oligopeptidase family serine peptidase [Akkermansiaceae bacterium]|nr:prolyl oligopeptidase family serine peptidase [Akkermansiaceae bacterium]